VIYWKRTSGSQGYFGREKFMESKNASRLNRMINDLDKWALKIYSEEIFHLSKRADEEPADTKVGLLRDFTKRVKMAKKKIRQQSNFEDYQRIHLSRAARKIRDILKHFNPSDFGDVNKVREIFTLGYYCGLRQALDPEFMPTDLYGAHFNSEMGRKYVMRRHGDKTLKDELLDEIEERAREYYESGGRKLHGSVASWFKEGGLYYDERYNDLNFRKIKKAVGNAAEEYGCKTGIRKQKSP
jgi:hypothetical protein